MIHIIHTPAAVLARRREALARRCLAAVLLPGLGVLFWAAATPIIEMRGEATCNFTGVPFVPEHKQHPAPDLKRFAAVTPPVTCITSPPLALAEVQLPELIAPDMEHVEDAVADEFDTPDEALLALHAPPEQPIPAQRRTAREPEQAISTYTPPDYHVCPQPPYPPRLRQRRAQGTVKLLIAVSAEGRPTEVQILAPSGHPGLDTHAQRWVLQHWIFAPARQNGKSLAAKVSTSITFSLHS